MIGNTQLRLAVLFGGLATACLPAAQPCAVTDTGQNRCYDNRNEIAPPKPGQQELDLA